MNCKPVFFILSPTESVMTKRGTRHPKLAEYLVKAGYKVEYITTDFSHAYKHSFTVNEIKNAQAQVPYSLTVLKMSGYKKNISFQRIFFNLMFSFKCLFLLINKIKPGDVLLVPSRPPELVTVATLFKENKNVISIVDIRDVWPDALDTPSAWQKKVFAFYCNLFLKYSLQRIDWCFHVAPSFLNWLHRYAPQASSSFLPLGFDFDRWSVMPLQDKFHDRDNTTISLVYVGVLTHQFNLLPVLEALVSRVHYKLTIIGDNGTGDRYPEVTKFISTNKMTNVVMLGHIPPEKVVEYLKYQDIGIVPMITNSIPNKVFDFLGAYLPMLSLGENDASEFVRKFDIGWTAPFDSSILGVLLDSITIKEICEKAGNVENIRDGYSKEYLFKSVTSLIDRIAENSGTI